MTLSTGTRIVAGESVTLTVEGDLDVATAPRLVATFDDALAGRPASILMDVSRVAFSDSTGIAALIRCRRRAHRHGIQLMLDVGDGAIARLLDLTRLDQVFDLVEPRT